MSELTWTDYTIIGSVLVCILGVGLAMSRRASANIESYFLGGRKIPWYLLGIMGMSGWFDLTGTMIITSFLFMMGPSGLYIEFRGGAALPLAFMLAYTGKWHRRSGCMTPAEWMTYRFGTGRSAEFLRAISALIGIVIAIGMLAYLVRGATLFMGIVFPFNPILLTLLVVGIASVYTVFAGFYGVVFTDLLQSAIILVGCAVISFIAWEHFSSRESFLGIAQSVLGSSSWASTAPKWEMNLPEPYKAYEFMMVIAAFYLVRNVLGGMSSGAESRFFAAKNAREASMQCLMQGLTVSFRWPLMISFAILGILLVSKAVPGQDATRKAAALITQSNPTLSAGNWHEYTSKIAHTPAEAPAELVSQLRSVLGANWQQSVSMISPSGRVNPEIILPCVVMYWLTPGVRGLLIVSLMVAMMGSLSGMVNGASAMFVRDIYQNFLRPTCQQRELISASHLSSAVIVLIGFGVGLAATSINELWSWLMMGLTAGSLGPGLLRLYWWRTTALGMATGLLAGGVAALCQRSFNPGMGEGMQFILMTLVSLGFGVVGSLLSKPTPESIVSHFYETTKPFGFWGPFRSRLSEATRKARTKEHRNDFLSAWIALVWQVCLFMIPMQFLTRNWAGLGFTVPLIALMSIGLYFFWWRCLPPSTERIPDFPLTPDPRIDEKKTAAAIPH